MSNTRATTGSNIHESEKKIKTHGKKIKIPSKEKLMQDSFFNEISSSKSDINNQTIQDRINKSEDLNKLLIQFTREGNLEGVKLLVEKHKSEISFVFNKLEAWKICIKGDSVQEEIGKILVTNSNFLSSVHVTRLRTAIIEEDEEMIAKLLRIFTISVCLQKKMCVYNASLAGNFFIVKKITEDLCKNSFCVECRKAFNLSLESSLMSGSMDIFKYLFDIYSKTQYATTHVILNNKILEFACKMGNLEAIDLIFLNLHIKIDSQSGFEDMILKSLDRPNSDVINKILMHLDDDDVDNLSASVLEKCLLRACQKDYLSTVELLLNIVKFGDKCVIECIDYCLSSNNKGICSLLFKEYPSDIIPHVLENGADIPPEMKSFIGDQITKIGLSFSEYNLDDDDS